MVFLRPLGAHSTPGLVAQSVEQCPFKALVVGSSPTQPTTSFPRSSLRTLKSLGRRLRVRLGREGHPPKKPPLSA